MSTPSYVQDTFTSQPNIAFAGQLMWENGSEDLVEATLLEAMFSGDAAILTSSSRNDIKALLRLPMKNKLKVDLNAAFSGGENITGTVTITDVDGVATAVVLNTVTYATSSENTLGLLGQEVQDRVNASVPRAIQGYNVINDTSVELIATDYLITAALTETGTTFTYTELSNDKDFVFLKYKRGKQANSDGTYSFKAGEDVEVIRQGSLYVDPEDIANIEHWTSDIGVRFDDGGTHATRRGAIKTGVTASSTDANLLDSGRVSYEIQRPEKDGVTGIDIRR